MAVRQAIRVSALDHALGVHTDLTQGNWSTISAMISQAQFAGADTLRVGVPVASNWASGHIDQLADAGFKLDMLVDAGDTPANNAAAIAKFAAAHPGSIAFVEGPNEPNNWGVDYAGLSGIAGAQAWQRDFFAAMNANPVTANITVTGMASFPAVAAASDANNLHGYPGHGNQSRADMQTGLNTQNAVDPGKPFVITEWGYYTLPGVNAPGMNWTGVDEPTQAKLMLNAYLDTVDLGGLNFGAYALRDWAGSDIGARFGLYRNDGTPKAAATALHHVQTVLTDGGANAATFSPGALDYSTTAPSDVRSMLMQKSTGDFVLAFWREPDVWNEAAGQPINPAGVSFNLRLAAGANTSVYDPMVGSTAVKTVAGATDVSLTVTDHPIFVTVAKAVQQPAAPVSLSAGAGSDTLVLKVSQDAYKGSAQYTVSVDGKQVGGAFTASASHAAGQSDTLTLKGDWAAGAHKVEVRFLNDAWGGSAAADRNLYVDGAAYNGQAVAGAAQAVKSQTAAGAFSFTEAAPAPAPVTKAGTAGADLFDATAAGGRFTGGGGRDLFVFDAGDGHVTITDFASRTDKLVFVDADRAGVATAPATEGGVSGLMVTYGGAGSVFLAGVGALAARDMLFA